MKDNANVPSGIRTFNLFLDPMKLAVHISKYINKIATASSYYITKYDICGPNPMRVEHEKSAC